jgi:hypothetical protein
MSSDLVFSKTLAADPFPPLALARFGPCSLRDHLAASFPASYAVEFPQPINELYMLISKWLEVVRSGSEPSIRWLGLARLALFVGS